MGGYFKPLRRKLGVLALVVACAAISVWFRSQHFRDSLTVAISTSTWEARSRDGVLELMWHRRFGTKSLSSFDLEKTRWKSYPIHRNQSTTASGKPNGIRPRGIDMRRWIYDKQSEFGIFTLAMGETPFYPNNPEYGSRIESRLVAIKILYIALLMTLISAYLLLSKPRIARQISDPDRD